VKTKVQAALAIVRRRLAGEVPLKVAFFYDMLIIGTLVNFAAGLCALAAVSLGLPGWAAIAIFLLPQPYNVMLLVSVWRSANLVSSRWGDVAQMGSALWLPAMLVI
jgi:hypothetical protein